MLAGTPHALHLARLRVLGALPEGTGAIKQFDESPMAALLAASPDTAGELRKSVFGGLVELPTEDLETLMLTVSTWYEASGSMNDAAKRLYVHPNTVRYRLAEGANPNRSLAGESSRRSRHQGRPHRP